jgi:SRSO17 transposase
MPGTLIPYLAKAINGRALGTTWKVSYYPVNASSTLTGLVNTEPGVGAQLPRAQKLQWFLSESNWDERKVQAERLKLLRENPATAPNAQGALVIDETGDRKDGHKTAHVARQYLGNVGKIDN